MSHTRKRSENRIFQAYLSYKDVLVRSLLRWSVQPSDVDDILQETLRRTLEADKSQPISYPKTYLFRVSRNVVFREQQRRSREVQQEIDEAVIQSNEAPTDDQLHYRQMLEVFCEALELLPEQHRRAIILRRVYGMSHKQIALKMGVSLSSVEKYFAQGMAKCQDVMVRRGYSLDPKDSGKKRSAARLAGLTRPDATHEGSSHE